MQKYSKLIIISLLVVLALGIVLYKNLAQTAEIALITNNHLPEGNACVTNLARLEVGNPCGSDSFRTISSWCSDGRYQRLGDGTGCVAFSDALTRAQISCGGVTCPPKPTPSSPAPTSTPPPAPPTAPSPSIRPSPSPSPLPSDCSLIKVQCIKAPCPDIVQCVATPAPTPTLVPTPTPPASLAPAPSSTSTPSSEPIALAPNNPGCYYQEPAVCLQLFGYQCKPSIVCPQPSPSAPSSTTIPTFTGNPTPLPVASIAPKALPSQAQAPRQVCRRLWFIRWCQTISNNP